MVFVRLDHAGDGHQVPQCPSMLVYHCVLYIVDVLMQSIHKSGLIHAVHQLHDRQLTVGLIRGERRTD